MIQLETWRPGDTFNMGHYIDDAAGDAVADADVVQLIAEFVHEDGTVLAKFAKTAEPGYEAVNVTSEVVDPLKPARAVYRFPITKAISEAWTQTSGKVTLYVKARLVSTVFVADGFRKTFEDKVAVIQPRKVTVL